MSVLAILVVLTCLPAVAFTPKLPVSGSMHQVLAGSVRINQTPARYFVYTVRHPSRVNGIFSHARALGWRSLPGVAQVSLSPVGEVKFQGYERAGRLLLIGAPEDPEDGESWVAIAMFDRPPIWVDGRGEAPGREPAGWPRLASSRRLLHLAGTGFEAACYRSPASSRALMAQAKAQLASGGWQVTQAGGQGLIASKPDGTEAVLFVRDEERDCTFLVISAGLY